MGEAIVYHVMHMEKCVAQVSTAGECKIYLEDFMPYDLVLEESDDFDDRINNVTNFYYSSYRSADFRMFLYNIIHNISC